MRRALIALLVVGGGARDAAAGPCDGVAHLVARSVWAGIEEELYAEIIAVNAHVTVLAKGGGRGDFTAAARLAETIDPDVVAVEHFAFGDGVAQHGDRQIHLTIKGVDPTRFTQVLGVSAHVVRGDPRVGESRIWLGVDGARALAVGIGDEISVQLHGGGSRRFRVAALHHYAALPDPYDSELAIVSLDDVRGWMDPEQDAIGIELALRDRARAQGVAAALTTRLGWSFVAMGWRELNKPLIEAVDERRPVLVTALTSALVGGASIWCRR